ncbi:MAG: hypothetical protein C0448_06735 [Sphingobacteriaceae bacterium]|nr:hypothetical protein [Sphingobacteriaceae bacterium]
MPEKRYKILNLLSIKSKMKTIYILAAVILFFSSSCKEQSTEVSTNDVMNSKSADGSSNSSLPDIKFEEETHDFGRITQGEKVTYAFRFKNTGGANLIISSATGSCGCTIPDYPKKPILPGEEAVVDVVFASEGKSGVVEKSVTLVTNCEPSTKIIYIKANIIVPTSANPSELPTAH